MKHILLIAINAKYPHTNLAVRCLSNELNKIGHRTSFIEHTINSDLDKVLADILSHNVDVYAFSCYIWNINHVQGLAKRLKKLRPKASILLGGPEVTFESEKIIKKNKSLDYIIMGEGEKAIVDFSNYINNDLAINECANLVYRNGNKIIQNEMVQNDAFRKADFPYNDLDSLKSRVMYYEASKGCPFKCGFCLSSLTKSYHEKDVETVKRDLKIFIDSGVKIVKFVDRTFNANKKRAFEIINYINEININTCFHLEIAPSLLDADFVNLLKSANKDFFQVEIGIQSTHKPTLDEINRNENFEKFSGYIKDIVNNNNVHVHVDLIAGLPHEGLTQFQKSFDDVFSLKAHNLQLGFLKLLKGSPLRANAERLKIKYEKKAPYEFIKTKDLSKKDAKLLEDIEYLLKRYYNSSLFFNTINYLAYKKKSAFKLFVTLNDYIKNNKLNPKKFTEQDLAKTLYGFADDDAKTHEFILYDILNKRKKPTLLPYIFDDARYRFKDDYIKKNKIKDKKHILPVSFTYDILGFISDGQLNNKQNVLVFDYSNFDDGVKISRIYL